MLPLICYEVNGMPSLPSCHRHYKDLLLMPFILCRHPCTKARALLAFVSPVSFCTTCGSVEEQIFATWQFAMEKLCRIPSSQTHHHDVMFWHLGIELRVK